MALVVEGENLKKRKQENNLNILFIIYLNVV